MPIRSIAVGRRRARLLIWVAAVAALGSACWWRLGTGTGTVTFSWTASLPAIATSDELSSPNGCFTTNGQQGELVCGCLEAGMTRVEAELAGRKATFECDDLLDGGRFGVFDQVPAGTESFTLTGLGPVYDSALQRAVLQPLYWAGGSLDVAESSANQEPTLSLAPLTPLGGTGDIELLWTFGGQTCAEAGNPEVSIQISPAVEGFSDAGPIINVTAPCSAQGIDGFRLTGQDATYSRFALSAFTDDGREWSASPSAFTNGITESALRVDLVSTSGPIQPGATPLDLTFSFGPDGGGCSAAGVDQVRVRLSSNQLGTWSSLIYDQTIPCVDPPSLGISNPDGGLGGFCSPGMECALPATEYLIYAQGLSHGSVAFQLNGTAVWCEVGEPVTDGVAGLTETYALDLPPASPP